MPLFSGDTSTTTVTSSGGSVTTTTRVSQTAATLVHAYGWWVVIPAAAPAVLALGVSVLLLTRARSWKFYLASALVLLVGLANLAGMLTVGSLFVPFTAGLVVAWAGALQRRQASSAAAPVS